jgi:hypothetical protein
MGLLPYLSGGPHALRRMYEAIVFSVDQLEKRLFAKKV